MSLKYAVVERERRFLVDHIPDGVVSTRQIVDRYVEGTRLRLREVTDDDGTITRKLGHKARLNKGPEEVVHLHVPRRRRVAVALPAAGTSSS